MELKNQVVSLELAKKLKELGVKQDSLFYWSNNGTYDNKKYQIESHRYFKVDKRSDYSAFTVAELGKEIEKAEGAYIYRAFYKCSGKENGMNEIILQSMEVNFVAKMLCYLIENKHIKL